MDVLKGIQADFASNEYSLTLLAERFSGFCKPEMSADERMAALIKTAVELTTQEAPDWEFIAARLLDFVLSESWRGKHALQEYIRSMRNCVILRTKGCTEATSLTRIHDRK